jgi:serine O-acetyltransferase
MDDAPVLADLGKAHTRGCIKHYRSLTAVLACDLYRYAGTTSAKDFWRHYLFTPGYHYTVLMRLTGYLRLKPAKGFGLFYLTKAMLLHARYKYGIAIPEYTLIGPGFFINRFGGVYFNGDAIIGRNTNFTHGTMLGQANRGPLAGSPIVGDRCFLAAGAKVVGRVTLGAGSSVGANAVVTKDVPPEAVVGGIPAKIISTKGSGGYVNREAPEELLRRCEDAFVARLP